MKMNEKINEFAPKVLTDALKQLGVKNEMR